MAVLFEATRIGNLSMANRFVRSATWEGLADDDGAVTPRLIAMVCGLASGGVGLIITGHAFVSPEGRALKLQTAIYSDDFCPAFHRWPHPSTTWAEKSPFSSLMQAPTAARARQAPWDRRQQ